MNTNNFLLSFQLLSFNISNVTNFGAKISLEKFLISIFARDICIYIVSEFFENLEQ